MASSFSYSCSHSGFQTTHGREGAREEEGGGREGGRERGKEKKGGREGKEGKRERGKEGKKEEMI